MAEGALIGSKVILELLKNLIWTTFVRSCKPGSGRLRIIESLFLWEGRLGSGSKLLGVPGRQKTSVSFGLKV